MVQFLRNLIKRFQRIIFWLWQQEGTPGQRARGLGVGVFTGCFPFFGIQTIFGIALAKLLKGNHLLAVTGTWISNPITYLPIYLFNYQVGCLVLDEGPSSIGLKKVMEGGLWYQGWFFIIRLLVGSFLVGSFAGFCIGGLVYVLLRTASLSKKIKN